MNRKKVLIFRFLAALIPLLMFAIVEGALNLVEVLPNRNLFIPFDSGGNAGDQYLVVNPRIGDRYFPRDGVVPTPRPNSLFLKDKPEDFYRVFVMGDSIVTGWPYHRHVGFSSILEQRLADALPGITVEVVNLGVAAFNSYSLLDMMDEVLEQEPDVILLYTGHNEYYGALGAASTATLGHSRWLVNMNLWLQDFKTVQLIKEGTYRVREMIAASEEDNQAHRTLMGQVVGNKAILLGDEVYERGIRQFEGNLNDILEKADEADVPVVISDLVMNLRDIEPFISIPAADGESADQSYEQAQNLEAEGNFTDAKQQYTRAKDLDALRFRAPSEFDGIIQFAAKKNNAHLVSLRENFEEASPGGTPGNSLFLEHLHPTVEGHFLMSETFFDSVLENGLLEKEWLTGDLLPDTHYRETWPVTEFDHALAKISIMSLKDHWPFVPEHESTNAVARYNPANWPEELAKAVFLEQSTYQQAQYKLAERFIENNEFTLAVKTFQALTKEQPLEVAHYKNAAFKLIAARQFQAAIPFLEQSLRLEDSFFANKWLGQILINSGKAREGLPYLERARQKEPEDVQVLSNLARTHIIVGNRDLAEAALNELEALDPNNPNLAVLRSRL
jgi:tetratricopeptide (TPR) repeat protein